MTDILLPFSRALAAGLLLLTGYLTFACWQTAGAVARKNDGPGTAIGLVLTLASALTFLVSAAWLYATWGV